MNLKVVNDQKREPNIRILDSRRQPSSSAGPGKYVNSMYVKHLNKGKGGNYTKNLQDIMDSDVFEKYTAGVANDSPPPLPPFPNQLVYYGDFLYATVSSHLVACKKWI